MPFLPLLLVVSGSETSPITRPSLIAKADPSDVVHYFGVGSNMLKSKVVNRGLNGSIEILDFQPAVVYAHRLAFNMRGFPPLEPGACADVDPVTLH